MTDCEAFIEELLGEGKALGWLGRWKKGLGLVWREAEEAYRKRGPVETSVSGFRRELLALGQGVEVYRHLRFHAGSMLLGPIGWLISLPAELLDRVQLGKGRRQSAAEILDNVAGRASGRILRRNHKGRISRDEGRAQLLALLGTQDSSTS